MRLLIKLVGNITCIFNRENNSFKAKVEVRNIKHISLNIAEEIKKILPPTLEKDLQDDEIICPVCHGLGIIKQDYNFGVKENDSEKIFKLNWYDNEYLTLCPHCYFGRLKTCKYCGKVLPKSVNRCDCKDFLEHEREKQRIKYQETIDKAKEIDLKDASYYMYDEQSEKYFFDEGEFVDYYLQEYKDGSGGCSNFNEFFEYEVPKVLWNCEETKISMDADSIIDNACEELHEDARDNISDEKELQEFLDKWCAKQGGTTTYYPCYREYVRVQKEWFG